MNSKAGTRLIVVLGMHRSGTSAITRGLGALGVELGDSLMPAASGNQKGYWEDKDFVKFNDTLMEHLGGNWHTLAPFSRAQMESAPVMALQQQAVDLMRQKIGSNTIFGLKDPRTARLLPFWKQVFGTMELDVAYVISLRHPMSVANSLATRDGFESVKSYFLWLVHMVPSVLESGGEQRLVVSYDQLMLRPEEQLNRIMQAFALVPSGSGGGIKEYVEEFLEQGLRHSQFETQDLVRDPGVPAEVTETYLFTECLARDEIALASEEAGIFFNRMKERIDEMTPALRSIDWHEKKIAGMMNALAQRDSWNGVLANEIVGRDSRIAAMTNELAKRDNLINQLAVERQKFAQVLAERDGLIAQLTAGAKKPS